MVPRCTRRRIWGEPRSAPQTRLPCASTALTKQLSLPAIKSDTTHDLALRAAKKRDAKQADINARTQREYELAHDD